MDARKVEQNQNQDDKAKSHKEIHKNKKSASDANIKLHKGDHSTADNNKSHKEIAGKKADSAAKSKTDQTKKSRSESQRSVVDKNSHSETNDKDKKEKTSRQIMNDSNNLLHKNHKQLLKQINSGTSDISKLDKNPRSDNTGLSSDKSKNIKSPENKIKSTTVKGDSPKPMGDDISKGLDLGFHNLSKTDRDKAIKTLLDFKECESDKNMVKNMNEMMKMMSFEEVDGRVKLGISHLESKTNLKEALAMGKDIGKDEILKQSIKVLLNSENAANAIVMGLQVGKSLQAESERRLATGTGSEAKNWQENQKLWFAAEKIALQVDKYNPYSTQMDIVNRYKKYNDLFNKLNEWKRKDYENSPGYKPEPTTIKQGY